MVSIHWLTLVYVLKINFIITPLKTEKEKLKMSYWFKRILLCLSVTACLEPGWNEKILKKRIINHSACTLVEYSYSHTAFTKAVIYCLNNKVLLL